MKELIIINSLIFDINKNYLFIYINIRLYKIFINNYNYCIINLLDL